MDSTEVQNPADAVPAETIRLLAGMLQQDPASITSDARLFDDLGLDSTTFLELLMQLETDLGVEFDPYTLEPRDFETVDSLIAYVRKQIEA